MAATAASIEFRRVYNQVQLICAQRRLRRQAGHARGARDRGRLLAEPARQRAGAEPAQPERKSVLVEANTLFLADLLGIGMDAAAHATARATRSIRATRRSPRCAASADMRRARGARPLRDGVDRGAAAGHAAGHAAAVGAALAARSAQPVPRPCTTRSARAARPSRWRRRKADPRVGYFDSGRYDFSDDLARTPRQRFVNRWRLEKKDPAAALSEPVKPIVYWIDRTVPVKYRAAITRRHPRVEQGVREDRLQERDRGQGPARRRRLRHARRRPRLGALDDQRLADASAPSARATSTRAAARSSTPTSASRACRRAASRATAGPGADRRPASTNPFGAQPLDARTSMPLLRLGPRVCNYADDGGRADGLRARRARGARRPRPRQPRGGSSSSRPT